MTDTQKQTTNSAKEEQEPINPASTREQVRTWLQWLPAWILIPLGLGPHGPADNPPSGTIEGGYGGPNDAPGHIGSGYGDGASDIGGGLSGF